MAQFSYGFCMAMLHSFWQAALLLLLYSFINKVFSRNNAPLAKRNFLFAMLGSQLVLSILTFYIYFSGNQNEIAVNGAVKDVAAFLSGGLIQAVTPWLFTIYVMVIFYRATRSIYTWHCFKQQYKIGLQRPAVDLKLFTQLKAHQFGIKRKVTLWLSSSVHTPVTFGFFRPIILLPVALLNNISTQQAETLILHELTHIRTNDYLLNWFLLFTETIFFFNPFVSGLCRRIRLEREKNCDISVISFQYSPVLYAETLLQAERMKQLVPNFQLAAVNRKRQLLHRIQFFTSEQNFKRPLRFNIIAPAIGLFLLLLLSSAILFNSNNRVMDSYTTAAIPYLPFNSLELKDAEYVNTELPIVKEEEKPMAKTAKQPAATKELKSFGVSAEPKAELADLEEVVPGFAMPAGAKQNDAAQQIIIKEESSGSKEASVKIYYLSFENGHWVLQPEGILRAKEILLDSLSKKIDTLSGTLKRIVPQQ